MPTMMFTEQHAFFKALRRAAKAAEVKLTKSLHAAIRDALGERDPQAEICRDGKGQPEADSELRDYERVPLAESVDEYFAREVLPHVPDAWVDKGYADGQDGRAGRVGYEINFNRYFYTYTPPRPLEAIEADIRASQGRIAALLQELL